MDGGGGGQIQLPDRPPSPASDLKCYFCDAYPGFATEDDLKKHVEDEHDDRFRWKTARAVRRAVRREANRRWRRAKRGAEPMPAMYYLNHFTRMLQDIREQNQQQQQAAAGARPHPRPPRQDAEPSRVLRPRNLQGRVVPPSHGPPAPPPPSARRTPPPPQPPASRKRPLCHICGKTFARKADLKRHMTYVEMKTAKCGACGVRMLSSDMENHVQEFHGSALLFTCRGCDATFATRAELNKHYGEEHAVPRDYLVLDDRRHFSSYKHVFPADVKLTLLSDMYALEGANIRGLLSNELAKRKLLKANGIVEILMKRELPEETMYQEFYLNPGFNKIIRTPRDIRTTMDDWLRRQEVILEEIETVTLS